jgi:hypothetical protein
MEQLRGAQVQYGRIAYAHAHVRHGHGMRRFESASYGVRHRVSGDRPMVCLVGMLGLVRNRISATGNATLRTRYPLPSRHGGSELLADADCAQRRSCQEAECVEDNWGDWGAWSSCNRNCGKGLQLRRRRCRPTSVTACSGVDAQTRSCPVPNSGVRILGTCLLLNFQKCTSSIVSTWSQWFAWSPCSVSCGSGTMQRKRICSGPACTGTVLGIPLIIIAGPDHETAICYAGSCTPLRSHRTSDAVIWASWSTWSRYDDRSLSR